MKVPTCLILASLLLLISSLQVAHDRKVFVVFGGENPIDVAVLCLAAATVVLTGVAVVVGGAAIWGYKEIREASIKAAIRTARETSKKVSKIVAKDVAESVASRVSKSTQPFESTQQEAEELIQQLDDNNE